MLLKDNVSTYYLCKVKIKAKELLEDRNVHRLSPSGQGLCSELLEWEIPSYSWIQSISLPVAWASWAALHFSHRALWNFVGYQAWLRLLTDPEKKSPPFFAFIIKNKKPMKAKKSYKDLIFSYDYGGTFDSRKKLNLSKNWLSWKHMHLILTEGFIVQSQSCLTLCDPMDCSVPDSLVLHYLQKFAQNHVHWVGDTLWTSHPLSPLLLLPLIS